MTTETKTKHTPGPWESSLDEINNNGHYLISDTEGHYIASTSRVNAHFNAHLIAAAPEMLEALRGMVKFLESQHFHKSAQYVHGQKLIAKAEGRT